MFVFLVEISRYYVKFIIGIGVSSCNSEQNADCRFVRDESRFVCRVQMEKWLYSVTTNSRVRFALQYFDMWVSFVPVPNLEWNKRGASWNFEVAYPLKSVCGVKIV